MNIINWKRDSRAILSLLILSLMIEMISIQAFPASAAFPGLNGKIAFESNRDGNNEIYVMNSDGSG
jgi:hypothetical protein